MENNHEANKHLTYEERNFIEIGLNQGRNYSQIAKDINKDRRTIAREIENLQLTEENVNKIKSHINSVSRDSLEGKTPYDVIEPIIPKEILLKLGIEKINADDVNLSPKLLKGGDK